MSKVVAIPGNELSAEQRNSDPNTELIERLERMLEDAKSGHLQCVAYANLYHDCQMGYGWVTGTRDDAAKLLGKAQVMVVDMAQGLIE